MKKTIKIEVPKGATPKMVPIGDDGWAVEFEDTKPEIEIGSWWVFYNTFTKIVHVIDIDSLGDPVTAERGGYYKSDLIKRYLPIPPKPDEDELKKQGYELTGEVREPKKGEHFVVWESSLVKVEEINGAEVDNTEKYGRRRWIVCKIALKGLDLLKTLIPGDYVEINGVGVFISFDVTKIRFIPEKDTGMWFTIYNNNTVDWELQFERAIGMKVSDITESHIEWRWKAPR
jgi:hypothetical protein